MRTTLAIDENLLEEAMKCTGEKTRTAVVNRALKEFVRRRKLEGLKNLSGKIHIDLDWRKMEEEELKAMKEHERLPRGRR
ncbi:MAG: type II toxin-antitoxin system VapB family antitoxin [Deltaproteobacteria bacterium]|nr:type II toxin-antitoxin system VapB family antitoxin [Deltaproteobacteria bacterium]